MTEQLLLTHRPIVCTRCMHGHQVEVITGRENTPTEYHCGYCGNYAIVGVNAQFPFMAAVKVEKRRSDIGIPASVKSDNNGSSPMQVGEALLKPKKEEKSMAANARCKVDGCEKFGAFRGFCATHFREEYGIAYYQYQRNRQSDGEDPREVAKRMGRTGTEAPVAETKGPKAEEKKPARETKPPANDVAKPEKEEAEHSEPTPAYDNKELEELAYPAYHPDRRTFSLAAPRPPIGLVGKDYITIVAREEFIEKIKEAADRDFRTPEQQVAYYLHKGMEAVGA